MKRFLGLFSFAFSFFLGVILSDNSHFVARKYKLKNAKIKKPLRIVLLSDLHGKMYGKNNEEIISKIKKYQPELVIMAGDMVTSKRKITITPMLDLVKNISEICPVYYGIGNHEQRLKNIPGLYEKTLEQIKKQGATVLDDASIYLEQWNITLSGMNLKWKFYDKRKPAVMTLEDMKEYSLERKADTCQILIAHNPEYFEVYSKWGADLTLSGHLHGGIMVLPCLGGVISPKFQLFPKYCGGYFHYNGKEIVVSRGLGSHTLPIRVFNPGELCVIDIDNK